MKKSQVNSEELLKDLDKILNNIKLLEKKDLSKKDINIIESKSSKDLKEIKNKYKDLDSKE
tara:strand:- start:393 stop:575 length:183 start_codon:yes stop_codon:yes gene_type:complete